MITEGIFDGVLSMKKNKGHRFGDDPSAYLYRVGELVRTFRAVCGTDYLYQGLHSTLTIMKYLVF
jgi:hypothetical protein